MHEITEERFQQNVREVVALLTDRHREVLMSLDEYYGRGPGHLVADIGSARHSALLPRAGYL